MIYRIYETGKSAVLFFIEEIQDSIVQSRFGKQSSRTEDSFQHNPKNSDTTVLELD